MLPIDKEPFVVIADGTEARADILESVLRRDYEVPTSRVRSWAELRKVFHECFSKNTDIHLIILAEDLVATGPQVSFNRRVENLLDNECGAWVWNVITLIYNSQAVFTNRPNRAFRVLGTACSVDADELRDSLNQCLSRAHPGPKIIYDSETDQ